MKEIKEYPKLTNLQESKLLDEPNSNVFHKSLGAPHIDSFNHFLNEGLQDCIKNIRPWSFKHEESGNHFTFRYSQISIAPPAVPHSMVLVRNKKIYPTECRQRAGTYGGMLTARIEWTFNGYQMKYIDREMGEIPIMVGSDACNLKGLTEKQLVAVGEHSNEWGGYFIMKGHEKIIRMLLMSRKNYPITVRRSTWKNRGVNFSDIGVLVRCVATDQTSLNNVLHFVNNGTAKFMFSMKRYMTYVPAILIMKILVKHSDEFIYQRLLEGYEDDHYYRTCVEQMLREVHEEGLHTHAECRKFLGNILLPRFNYGGQELTEEEIITTILEDSIFIHLKTNEDKFNLMVFMIQKLFQCVQNKHKIENADSVMMQEVLMGGHLYQKVLKERLDNFFIFIKLTILKKYNTVPNFNMNEQTMMQILKSVPNIERSICNFLSTGNVNPKANLGLMQTTGLVIMAENINRMRYMSHFRAIHRGSYFVEMRTTEARQLLPDAWGFICPVHTPDGTPCGLLNHLTVNCIVTNAPDKKLVDNIPKVLTNLGMIPISINGGSGGGGNIINFKEYIVVMLEGKILGHIRIVDSIKIVNKLRLMKIAGQSVPNMMEIALVPNKKSGQYPGLFLFVESARMMRSVKNLAVNAIEYIGTFEQVYMDICITPKEMYPNLTTHMELSKTAFMSNLANLIPMPDCNQSPRNMYQCQMGKQTMGTPCHNWKLQAETKLYRLQTPATPLFRPVHHDNIELDDFAMGTNAIVAVISYTGYDMEDAMIINKSAFERGFAHGSIQKSEFIELNGTSYFARNPHDKQLNQFIDNDGLPYVGRQLKFDEIYYCYFNTESSVYETMKFKGKENCVIDNVRYCGNVTTSVRRKVCLTVRVPRNPSVGDKFASRAGQKGICSQKWPAEDLPFTETGLIPDIVFNPHGFPSRMTIAMMIETMAGKSASIHGLVHDATPFRFNEENTAIDYFGRLLQKGGYNYYGTERLYSGVDGREMKADIFFGVVHYQRLRHMVSDKWQVRSTGPIDILTNQPIKGRKRGGGVRFGEMERDALISHGASFLLQDRLFHCSDKTEAKICKTCGTIIGPINQQNVNADNMTIGTRHTCLLCNDKSNIESIQIPYIFKFLVTQLSSVNINVKLTSSEI